MLYQDRNGSVLDNTIVMYGSGASTTHNSHNLPTLIAGGCNMGLKHGGYWRGGRRAADVRMSTSAFCGLSGIGRNRSPTARVRLAVRSSPALKRAGLDNHHAPWAP